VVAGSQAGEQRGSRSAEEQLARGEVARLTLRQQVGQLLVSSFDGTRVPAYLRRRLRAGQTAGVILFRQNVASPTQLRALTRSLQRSAHRGALVSTDQEGGLIRGVAFAGPSTAQPGQGSPRRTGALAHAAARRLRAAGISVTLAPVADVAAGPDSVMRARGFRGSAAAVAARVRAAVRGWRRGGIAATAKHFPGLGAAARNTDDSPVTITRSRRRLGASDLRPFRAAITASVPLVMASHARYTAYDRRRIASQSESVLRRLLRDRLHFAGVVVTDSIEAEAVLRRSSVAIAAERSVRAGADLVLMTGSASWKLVFPRLLARARSQPGFRARVRESAARVLALKRRLGLRNP
jgi:beta-N-acetylhexosaminidase